MQAPQDEAAESGAWQSALFQCLKNADVRQVPYVPDAGHSQIIRSAHFDPDIKAYPVTTEEEGVAAVCGAWLGGERSLLLMQSSGVGNCVNMLSLVVNCRFPFATIVTMRGEYAEYNPWQNPMGRATQGAFELIGISVRRAETPQQVRPVVEAALDDAFLSNQGVAVLLSQALLGRKTWTQ